jgi:hypothetical protein
MKFVLTIIIVSVFSLNAKAQNPSISTKYSEPLAVYLFTKSLQSYQGDNAFKKAFTQSSFNTKKYQDLIAQLDTLSTDYSYQYLEYPYGTKVPGMTSGLLKKNLIAADNLDAFMIRSVGIIPNKNLVQLTHILKEFIPVYRVLVYEPNQIKFEEQLVNIKNFVQEKQLVSYFKKGSQFYKSEWDNAIPLEIVFYPLPNSQGFTAEAFYNIGVSAIQTDLKNYDILLSVMLHEIFHIQFDEQPIEIKNSIQSWFLQNPSKCSNYAYLLLNEVLATAIGNGYVYEQLHGNLDKGEWYNLPYINQLAKEVYPLIATYLKEGKSIDKDFVDNYIKAYEEKHANWINELEHTMSYRFILSHQQSDFNVFRQLYPYCSIMEAEDQITEGSIEKMKAAPLTKVIIVSKNNKSDLALIKKMFPELKNWNYNATKEFSYAQFLNDKSQLYIINQISSSTETLIKQLKP